MLLGKLKRRSDFVAVRDRGVYLRFRSINLQLALADLSQEGKGDSLPSGACAAFPVFIGITTSRRVGNAVFRNYARRRIRAWIHERFPVVAQKFMCVSNDGAGVQGAATSSKEELGVWPLETLPDPNSLGLGALKGRDVGAHSLTLSKPSLATLPKKGLGAPRALVVVFIATAKTAEVSFPSLSADLERAFELGFKKLVGDLAA